MTIEPKTLLPGDIITVRLAVGKLYYSDGVLAGPICDPNRYCLNADIEIIAVERPKAQPKVGDFVRVKGNVWEVLSLPRTAFNGDVEWAVFCPHYGCASQLQAWIDTATIVDRPDWAGEAGGE